MNGISALPKDIEAWLGSVNKNSSFKMAMSNFLGGSLSGNIKYLLAKLSKKGQK